MLHFILKALGDGFLIFLNAMGRICFTVKMLAEFTLEMNVSAFASPALLKDYNST